MSAKTTAAVWELPLDPIDKIVLLAMADHADPHGGNIYPKVATLAKMTGLGVRALQKRIQGLEARGYLVRERCGGGRKPNIWRIVLEPPSAQSAPPPAPPAADAAQRAAVHQAAPERCTGIHRRGEPRCTAEVNHGAPLPNKDPHMIQESYIQGTGPGTVHELPPVSPEGGNGAQQVAAPAEAARKGRARKAQPTDALSDLIAREALGLEKGDRFTSVTAREVAKALLGESASAAQVAALVERVAAAYAWWRQARPNLSAPLKAPAIIGMLRSYEAQVQGGKAQTALATAPRHETADGQVLIFWRRHVEGALWREEWMPLAEAQRHGYRGV